MPANGRWRRGSCRIPTSGPCRSTTSSAWPRSTPPWASCSRTSTRPSTARSPRRNRPRAACAPSRPPAAHGCPTPAASSSVWASRGSRGSGRSTPWPKSTHATATSRRSSSRTSSRTTGPGSPRCRRRHPSTSTSSSSSTGGASPRAWPCKFRRTSIPTGRRCCRGPTTSAASAPTAIGSIPSTPGPRLPIMPRPAAARGWNCATGGRCTTPSSRRAGSRPGSPR